MCLSGAPGWDLQGCPQSKTRDVLATSVGLAVGQGEQSLAPGGRGAGKEQAWEGRPELLSMGVPSSAQLCSQKPFLHYSAAVRCPSAVPTPLLLTPPTRWSVPSPSLPQPCPEGKTQPSPDLCTRDRTAPTPPTFC